MKAIVLLNGLAGSLAASPRQDEADRIRAGFSAEGIEAEVRAVPGERLCRAAQQARSSDAQIIVAGGGDGTINAVASQLVGSDKLFGLLPLGTMNHLARELEIPLDLEGAVRAIARGRVRELPVGEVNGQIFLSFSGIGLYAEVIKHRDAQRTARGRGKWPAMAVALARMLRRFPLFRVRVGIGDVRLRRLTPLVFIALSEYQMRMFGVEDYACGGRRGLNLYIARETRRLGLLWLIGRAVLGLVRPGGDFEAICLEQVELTTHRRHVRVAIDGEVIDLECPLRYRLIPAGLNVLVPGEAGTRSDSSAAA